METSFLNKSLVLVTAIAGLTLLPPGLRASNCLSGLAYNCTTINDQADNSWALTMHPRHFMFRPPPTFGIGPDILCSEPFPAVRFSYTSPSRLRLSDFDAVLRRRNCDPFGAAAERPEFSMHFGQ